MVIVYCLRTLLLLKHGSRWGGLRQRAPFVGWLKRKSKGCRPKWGHPFLGFPLKEKSYPDGWFSFWSWIPSKKERERERETEYNGFPKAPSRFPFTRLRRMLGGLDGQGVANLLWSWAVLALRPASGGGCVGLARRAGELVPEMGAQEMRWRPNGRWGVGRTTGTPPGSGLLGANIEVG